MLTLRTLVKVERKGVDLLGHVRKLRKELAAGPTTVKVGFPSGAVPSDIIKIALWNHEGTGRAKGDVFFRGGQIGFSGPIPPRPFLTMAMFHGRAELRRQMRADAKAIIGGKMTLTQALSRLGVKGQDLVQMQIGSNMGPPNSSMTVTLKGSSRTLIDTGRLFGSVTWVVDR